METLAQSEDSDGATVGNPPTTTSSRSRRTVAALGRVLITLGVVLLLFVAYQLWGTGLREAASQRDLRARFETKLTAGTPLPPSRPTAPDSEPAADADAEADLRAAEPQAQDRGVLAPGDPVAILRIPKLGLDKVVVEGTDVASLRKGPGHQPGTALPGMPGNAVIAGHRTTYGAPFYRLDELAAGDPIVVEAPSGTARYVVTGTTVVEPDDVWILEPTDDDRLTLFTCTPRFSVARRLVVTARLGSAPPVLASPQDAGAAQPAAAPPAASLSAPDTLAAPTGSLPAAVAWAAATALTMAVIWWAGRRWRRIIVYPLGTPILVVVLFVTFEEVAELLPPAL